MLRGERDSFVIRTCIAAVELKCRDVVPFGCTFRVASQFCVSCVCFAASGVRHASDRTTLPMTLTRNHPRIENEARIHPRIFCHSDGR